jgi:hypothetical protein
VDDDEMMDDEKQDIISCCRHENTRVLLKLSLPKRIVIRDACTLLVLLKKRMKMENRKVLKGLKKAIWSLIYSRWGEEAQRYLFGRGTIEKN